jgi:hypothetical protein
MPKNQDKLEPPKSPKDKIFMADLGSSAGSCSSISGEFSSVSQTNNVTLYQKYLRYNPSVESFPPSASPCDNEQLFVCLFHLHYDDLSKGLPINDVSDVTMIKFSVFALLQILSDESASLDEREKKMSLIVCNNRLNIRKMLSNKFDAGDIHRDYKWICIFFGLDYKNATLPSNNTLAFWVDVFTQPDVSDRLHMDKQPFIDYQNQHNALFDLTLPTEDNLADEDTKIGRLYVALIKLINIMGTRYTETHIATFFTSLVRLDTQGLLSDEEYNNMADNTFTGFVNKEPTVVPAAPPTMQYDHSLMTFSPTPYLQQGVQKIDFLTCDIHKFAMHYDFPTESPMNSFNFSFVIGVLQTTNDFNSLNKFKTELNIASRVFVIESLVVKAHEERIRNWKLMVDNTEKEYMTQGSHLETKDSQVVEVLTAVMDQLKSIGQVKPLVESLARYAHQKISQGEIDMPPQPLNKLEDTTMKGQSSNTLSTTENAKARLIALKKAMRQGQK